MTQYLEFNGPTYSVNQSVLNTISSGNVCFCCLAQNKAMIDLNNCKHNGFLQQYFTMEFPKIMLVCINCHTMLKKIMIFQKQVEECCKMLKHQVLHETTNKLFNLEQSDVTITFNKISDIETETDTEIKEELEYKEDTGIEFKEEFETNQEEDSIQSKTNVKMEHESSDFENDVPLAEIKEKEKCGRKPKVPSLDEKYEGKIKVVALTKEELMEERERESKKESYLRLPFKCENCIKGFDNEVTLKNHNEKQHGKEGAYRCDICLSVLRSEPAFKEHAKRHLRRYECMVCGKRNTDIYSISQHYNQQHYPDGISMQFSCDQCKFTTNSHRGYRYHRDKHKPKPQCTICGNTFVSTTGLRVHMNSIHKQSTREFKCSICDKTYKCKSGLFNHTAVAHGTGAGAYCSKCRTHFASKNNLMYHLKLHSAHITEDSKKFACDECNSRFLTRAALRNHINWDHLKSVKFECKQCSKEFKTAGALRRHKSYVHEKKRPPRDKICDYCGRGFFTTAILVSHIRTHTGARPLRCSHCAATFAHAAALYTHKKLLHRK